MKIKLFLCSLMALVFGLSAAGQSTWKGLIDTNGSYIVKMKLERYGLYDNGRELNSFYPSSSNNNAGEKWILSFNRSGKPRLAMEMSHTQDGNSELTASYSGNTITEKTRKQRGKEQTPTGWQFKLLSYQKQANKSIRVKTVDSNNTYRYFIIKPKTDEDVLFDSLF